jgi:hypothetical protein
VAEYVPETPAASPGTATYTETGWAAELTKEPLDIYDDFTAALQAFAAPVPLMAETVTDPLPVSRQGEEPAEALLVPAVLTVVAERLAGLEPSAKEQAAPILRDIVGAVHGLRLLEARGADPEMVAATAASLEASCIVLFETIGITEYSEEEVRQFMEIISQPDFRPPDTAEPETPDLEKAGTREAKRHSLQLGDGLANIETQLQRVLGMVALFHAHPAAPVTVSI